MRKHLYLITEHDKQDRIGGCKIIGQRLTRPEKNEEGPIQKFDRDEGRYYTVGKMVGLGYADFDSEEEYEEKKKSPTSCRVSSGRSTNSG